MLICRSIVKVIIFPDGMIAFLACDLYFPAITIVVVICKPVRNRNNIRILIVDIFTTFILHLFYRPLVFGGVNLLWSFSVDNSLVFLICF